MRIFLSKVLKLWLGSLLLIILKYERKEMEGWLGKNNQDSMIWSNFNLFRLQKMLKIGD